MKRLLMCVVLACAARGATTLDFEGFLDGTSLTNQYPAVTFGNATVLTAGLSLNEFEFPPVSGTNVIFDDSGPVNLSFSLPQFSFAGYFTYTSSLTLTFYDSANTVLGVVNSAFASNTAISGDAGSAPNELLAFSSLAGIQSVQIFGDVSGGSFTADDLVLTPPVSADVPEPALLLPVGASLWILSRRRRSL